MARPQRDIEQTFVFPDGQTARLGNERFRAPEGLFNPSVFGYECPGIADLAFNAIMKCDIDIRKVPT